MSTDIVFPYHKRLYPTEQEEREYRELKERYGFRDALVVKAEPDQESQEQQRSLKRVSAPHKAPRPKKPYRRMIMSV